jgi:hypothetical protein
MGFLQEFHVYTTKGLVEQHFRYPNHDATLIIKLVLIEMKEIKQLAYILT